MILNKERPTKIPIQRSTNATGWPRVAFERESHSPSPMTPPTTTLKTR